MRAVTGDDAVQVWRINSEPSTRARSFDPSAIPLDAHFAWFDRYLASRSGRMYACMREDEMAGVIRFDRVEAGVAELSFAVASPFRGLGLGRRMLTEIPPVAAADLQVATVRGIVVEDNLASLAAFARAGFAEVRRGLWKARHCIVFERRL
jgi:RimJ/RimL family protein N-acetyltransferase